MKIRGFTLVETMITLGIFSIIALGVISTFNGLRSRLVLEDSQAAIINALERARSRAATGVGTIGADHGVMIDVSGKQIINFRSDGSVTTTDEEVTLPANISIVGSDQEIIFNRLSATSSASTTITIQNINGATATISISEDGIIEK